MPLLNTGQNNQKTRDEIGQGSSTFPKLKNFPEQISIEEGPHLVQQVNIAGSGGIYGHNDYGIYGVARYGSAATASGIWGSPEWGVWGTMTWGPATVDTSFILGSSVYGILGTSTLGRAPTQNVFVRVTNVNNRFIERFGFDYFEDDLRTTADWDTTNGWLLIDSGEVAYSKAVFLNDTTVTNATLTLDADNLTTSSIWNLNGDLLDSGVNSYDAILRVGISYGGYYPFDGDATDESTKSNDGVVTGATLTTDRFGSTNNAYLFSGADDKITIADNSNVTNLFHYGSGAGAIIVAVINPTSVGETYGRILDKAADNSTDDGWHFYLREESAGYCKISFGHGFDVANGEWKSDDRVIELGATNIITLYYDAASDSNDPVIYVNGVNVALTETETPSGTAITDAGNDLLIGDCITSQRCFDGVIDEIIICHTYASVIEADHLSIYNLLVKHKLNQVYVPGKIEQGIETLGWNDAYGFNVGGLVADDSAQYASTTGTISLWVYPERENEMQDLVSIKVSTSDYLLVRINTANNIGLIIEEGNVVKTAIYTATNSLTVNAWNHIVVQQTGSEAEVYINNVKQTPTGTNSTYWTDHLTSTPLTMGYSGWIGYTGKMDNVRIYPFSLTSTARDRIYNSGSGTESDSDGVYPLTLKLSANGGRNFESITDGVKHTFTTTGTDLRFKIESNNTVKINWIKILYNS